MKLVYPPPPGVRVTRTPSAAAAGPAYRAADAGRAETITLRVGPSSLLTGGVTAAFMTVFALCCGLSPTWELRLAFGALGAVFVWIANRLSFATTFVTIDERLRAGGAARKGPT